MEPQNNEHLKKSAFGGMMWSMAERVCARLVSLVVSVVLARILMPEDYEGFPQRRDFPMGGEPVIFTFNEHKLPRWYD